MFGILLSILAVLMFVVMFGICCFWLLVRHMAKSLNVKDIVMFIAMQISGAVFIILVPPLLSLTVVFFELVVFVISGIVITYITNRSSGLDAMFSARIRQ